MLGNEEADKLARYATSAPLPPTEKLVIGKAIRKAQELLPAKTFHDGRGGRFTKYLDSALPEKHTSSLYNNLTHQEAHILCQLRSGKNRLNSYTATIDAAISGWCDCGGGQAETVRHFLFECPRWVEQRGTLKSVAGNRWGNLSYFLGGRSEQKLPYGAFLDGEKDSWKPNLEVLKTTIVYAKGTGGLS